MEGRSPVASHALTPLPSSSRRRAQARAYARTLLAEEQ